MNLYLVTITESNCTSQILINANDPILARMKSVKELGRKLAEGYKTKCCSISKHHAKQLQF